MEDFANHYGFVVIPARVGKPKDKASVENQVKIIYSRVYAKIRDQKFFSLESLNRALSEKTLEHNQTRMQQRDYSRQEKFLADEKHLLRQLPQTDFEVKYYTKLRVGLNNCIYLGRDRHYYSVPHIHIGEEAQIIYTRKTVKIFCRNEQVAIHERKTGFGYSVIKEHLCSSHRHYGERSPQYYMDMAEKRSASLAELIRRIFDDTRPPEIHYKACDGLLSLSRKTNPVLFEKACLVALEHGITGYKFVKSLLTGNHIFMDTEHDNYKPLPKTDDTRGKAYYQ
jgi:hypothetical protein